MPSHHLDEQRKWDDLYGSLDPMAEEPSLHQFSQELAEHISDLLKPGSRILEAGCGGGHQSLELARLGRFKVTLLDFSKEALKFAERLFAKEHLPASFEFGDVFQEGEPDYDLVFNSGVLEHYTLDEQAAFLKGMASRSRQYVLALVPNRQCYWYWLWRVRTAADGNWPYGKEVPMADMSAAFEKAGLRLVGQAVLGEVWAENFITYLPGLSPEIRDEILAIHRSPLVPFAAKGYLLAALGTVEKKASKAPPIWQKDLGKEEFREAELLALLSDALALRLGAEKAGREELSLHRARLAELEQHIKDLLAHRQVLEALLNQASESLSLQSGQLSYALASIGNLLGRYRSSRQYKGAKLLGALKKLPLGDKMKLVRKVFQKASGGGDTAGIPEPELIVSLLKLIEETAGKVRQLRQVQVDLSPALFTPSEPVFSLPSAQTPILGTPFAPVAGSSPQPAVYPIQPKVSVLLPVYNHAHMLPLAIESVRAQTYGNWELVILDDGSRDAIDPVLERYRDDPRIRIYRQENQKLPNALTHLHQLAEGHFITWTSADNLLEPQMIETLVEALSKDPATVMVYADGGLIDEEGNPLEGGGYRDHNRDPYRPEVMRLDRDVAALGEEPDNFINACFLYRSAAVRLAGGYAPDLNGLEDYDFFLRLRHAGTCRHIGNRDPLYWYRVHKQTMSEELLSTQREAHLRRAKALIAYDRERTQWCRERWQVVISPEFPAEAGRSLMEALALLPVNIKEESGVQTAGRTGQGKRIVIIPDGQAPPPRGCSLRVGRDGWELMIGTEAGVSRLAVFPAAVDTSPLATKARGRQSQVRFHEFLAAGMKPVVLVHCAISECHMEFTRSLIHAHPDLFFALYDDPVRMDPKKGSYMVDGCTNAIYLGARPLGENYGALADSVAILCPPLEDGATGPLWQSFAVALASDRRLLYPASVGLSEPLPFALSYFQDGPLPEVWRLPPLGATFGEDMERWRKWISTPAKLTEVLAAANTALQETFVSRPDFQQMAIEKGAPSAWPVEQPWPFGEKGWVGLWTDTLDKGGLEEVVALLALGLRNRGVPVRILCSLSGGLVASRLRLEGIPVECFQDDASKFKAYLRADPPVLLHANYTRRLLAVPQEMGLPMIDTIHNMYAHLDETAWEEERRRASHFSHLVAVSELVRDYYLAQHGTWPAGRTSVIFNAADSRRVFGFDRETARGLLGYRPSDVVFLNLASFDGRKNQIGLLTAFDLLFRENPLVRLILAGNRASQVYFEEMMRHLKGLPSQRAVTIAGFTPWVAPLLAAADVFVLASYVEGWSIAGTEAAYSGLPIVHTNCGSGGVLCDEGGGVLVANPGGDPLRLTPAMLYGSLSNPQPPNTRELVAALAGMAAQANHCRKERALAASRALDRFSAPKMVREYRDCYLSILQAGFSALSLP